MNLLPELVYCPGMMLAGHRMHMSYAQNRTPALWQGFMPRRHALHHTAGADLYSVQVYPVAPTDPAFTPYTSFDKWAALSVSSAEGLPGDMDTLTIPEGWYAVWLYKGTPDAAAQTFAYIFGQWLPQSGYVLDDRPHFEVLGERYRHNHPDSEEHIWIPVRQHTAS